MKGRCCVFQPFDRGAHDKRYDDILVPAIRAAGLEPYRVDRDDGAVIPIDTLHDEIKSATLCLADIGALNPNVMYELGYAIASGKDVVIICPTSGSGRFPFDIQHRGIIKYSSDSVSDFEKLKSDITKKLTALLEKQRSVQQIVSASPVKSTEGLMPHEVAALAFVLANRRGDAAGATLWAVSNDMEKAGYNEVGTQLSLVSLGSKGLIESEQLLDQNGDPDVQYKLTSRGTDWLLTNQDKLELRTSASRPRPRTVAFNDDDVPF